MIFSGHRGIEIKKPEQIKQMRKAGLIVAKALKVTAGEARAGMSTRELDAIAAEVISAAGAKPSFLNYGEHNGEGGFTGVVCLSVNEEIVHGMPGDRVLADGDVLSIDCGAIVDGWHGDSARTVFIGEPTVELQGLSDACEGAMWAGIGAAKLGGRVGDISAAIESDIRGRETSYGIVAEYVGHGIGSAMHQPPDVPNLGKPGRGPKLVEGMCLCIEPMLTIGSAENTTLDDDWTVVTSDGSVAAHWEHAITVTKNGVWVLTAEDGGEAMLNHLGVPFGPLAD